MLDWPDREGYWWAMSSDYAEIILFQNRAAYVHSGKGSFTKNGVEDFFKEKVSYIWIGPLVRKTLDWPNDKGHWGLIPIETVEDGLTPIHDTVTYYPDPDSVIVTVSVELQPESTGTECQIWGVDSYSRAEFEKKFGKYKFYQINRHC